MKRLAYVTVTVATRDETLLARVVESLSRMMSGLAMEGLTITLTAGPESEEQEEP
jgi:hypothetical protein